MNLKFSTLLIGLSTLLLTQTTPLVGQQIPASELPPAGSDTGLNGKYDPQNGIAQVVRGEYQGVAIIFHDDHVMVFMTPDEVVAPGHVLVVQKRLGASNLLELYSGVMCDLLYMVSQEVL